MRARFFTVAACGTLLADAYLGLASVATRMMRREYHQYLPPFDEFRSEGSRFLVLFVATWTALLALGCLRASRADDAHTPAVLWFVLVLAVIWLGVLLPTIKS